MNAESPRSGMLRNLEEFYQSWTPLLLSALGRLRRSGYPLDLAEGMDLVHDFYVEAVPGLLARYEPERAQFSTYLYGAFLHFARPRIVRELRWKGMLTDLDELPPEWMPISEPALVDPNVSSDSDELIDTIGRQFASLPSSLRAVVTVRILDGLSEREAARRLKLSRYSVRQRTAEALGRLAVGIGEDHRIGSEFRPLALRVWRDGKSLMRAAGELGLSRAKARANYRRLLDSVMTAATRTRERNVQESQVMDTNLCEVWTRLIANPSDTDAITAARASLALLLDHISECDACRKTAETSGDPERVFEALADEAEVLSPEEARARDALHDAWDSNERDIETAMSDLLLSALPDSFADLGSLGENVTPVSAFLALSAIDHLVYRHLAFSERDRVELTANGAIIDGTLAIPRQAIVAEMARHAELPSASAERLFDWALRVPRYVPKAFLHFVEAQSAEDSVHLTLGEPALQHNLAERFRWRHAFVAQRQPVPATVAVALRQIQAAAEILTPQLEKAANNAVHDDVRDVLLQQAAANKQEAAAIAGVLESVHVEGEVAEVLQAAAGAEQCKQVIYEKVGEYIRGSDFKGSDIQRIVEEGQAESQSRAEKVENVAKAVAGAAAG
jgi:RNA polymerase sigma factor (sigma-70 family)